jgi:hypothetical protein
MLVIWGGMSLNGGARVRFGRDIGLFVLEGMLCAYSRYLLALNYMHSIMIECSMSL